MTPAVVKIVTSGQIAAGYKLTNIFASPATVTIYSSDPEILASVNGYLETTPINLNGANDDMEIRVSLNLPKALMSLIVRRYLSRSALIRSRAVSA